MDEIERNWGNGRIFIDCKIIDNYNIVKNGIHPMEFIIRECLNRNIDAVPVIGLKTTEKCQSAISKVIKTNNNRICIRVTLDQLNHNNFEEDIISLLETLNVNPETISLIVDCQSVSDANIDYQVVCDQIPYLDNLSDFIMLSGAFPKDLSELERNRQHTITRYDWLAWQEQVKMPLQRVPIYGDYTVQYGLFVEPPNFPNMSASIRYTSEDYWVIMRGEGVRNPGGPGYRQWPANAFLLCERSEFCGKDFSYGDEYIYEKSKMEGTTGNAGTWIRAGINHHLTYVARQVRNSTVLLNS